MLILPIKPLPFESFKLIFLWTHVIGLHIMSDSPKKDIWGLSLISTLCFCFYTNTILEKWSKANHLVFNIVISSSMTFVKCQKMGATWNHTLKHKKCDPKWNKLRWSLWDPCNLNFTTPFDILELVTFFSHFLILKLCTSMIVMRSSHQ